MFNAWRASTIVFLLALIVGTCLFAETKDVSGSALVVAVICGLIAATFLGEGLDPDAHMALLPTAMAATTVFMATLQTLSYVGVALALMLVISFTYLAAAVSARSAGQSVPEHFATRLPGIGIVAGGILLLYRKWHERGTYAH